jgi:membrane associated rhomboid family serine protease
VFYLFVLVMGGAAWYFMSAKERAACSKAASQGLREVKDVVILGGLECDEFAEALRTRTRQVIAAPVLIALTTALTLLGWLSPGWGAAGWRHLLISAFTHPTVPGLILSGACLLQVGLVLERLVGARVFAIVYVSAGAAIGIAGLIAPSFTTSLGGAASVLAIYGLLLVTWLRGLLHRSELTIPWSVAARLAALGIAFFLWVLMTVGLAHLAPLAALITGVIAGLAVARDVHERTPPVGRVSECMAIMIVIAAVHAGGVALQPKEEVFDVRPEINRVIAIEKQTSELYDHAVERFKSGRISTANLAELIEQTIEPRLRLVVKRLRSLRDVPPEYQPRVAAAEEFLALRDESWRLRAQALHRSDTAALRQADIKEQESLATLKRIQ